MGMRAVGLLLLLVTLLTMPGSGAEVCGEGEYLFEGICCVLCPAGTYVAQHCSTPHSRGRCASCTEGRDYTAHANGLEECLLCRQCKDDQITSRTCTVTNDAECQCKQGYFCPAEGCEICQKCSQMCPEGEEIVQICNATMDRGCGLPNQGNKYFTWMAVIILVAVFPVGLLVFYAIRKCKSDKATLSDKEERDLASEDKTLLSEVKILENNASHPDSENSGENPEGQAYDSVNLEMKNTSPEENSAVSSKRGTIPQKNLWHQTQECWKRIKNCSSSTKNSCNSTFQPKAQCKVQKQKCKIIVKDLTQKEQMDCFSAFINTVPVEKWKKLMRTHLDENVIVKIEYEWPKNIYEQSYQMLLTWKNTLGEKQAIIKLLDELWDIDTKAYGKIVHALTSNNIISKIEATA
ncbi:tumor necrosis factor receptor superfamily member 6-like isoform X2 [Phasianus colchicus]|uniref:tumor necrosis factor receptor superfamily member 6-like isoform X2 n=1 Tax=Phasianus colchicus TaxID=9054 RepID=UPI00129DB2B5|nr:tumor necrosis factor receptor superfamily member 6-like isoform X2 [Phasianus colchicus]